MKANMYNVIMYEREINNNENNDKCKIMKWK